MGMTLGSNDLLPGETVQFAKKANAVVKVDEAGLTRYHRDRLMGTIHMQGSEAISRRRRPLGAGPANIGGTRATLKPHILTEVDVGGFTGKWQPPRRSARRSWTSHRGCPLRTTSSTGRHGDLLWSRPRDAFSIAPAAFWWFP